MFQVTPLGVDGVTSTVERWSSAPPQDSHEYRDIYGNRCQRIVVPPGRSQIRYDAVAHGSGRDRGLRPVRAGIGAARPAG